MKLPVHFPSVARDMCAALRTPLLAFAILGATTSGAFAHPPGGEPAHATVAADDVITHVDGMLQYVYENVGASEAQKTQITSIMQQAQGDLAQLQTQRVDGHARLFALLTQPTINRSAVEAERVAHVSIHEQASKRVMQFLLDVAEVLTPAQRKAMADHFAQHSTHGS